MTSFSAETMDNTTSYVSVATTSLDGWASTESYSIDFADVTASIKVVPGASNVLGTKRATYITLIIIGLLGIVGNAASTAVFVVHRPLRKRLANLLVLNQCVEIAYLYGATLSVTVLSIYTCVTNTCDANLFPCSYHRCSTLLRRCWRLLKCLCDKLVPKHRG